MEHFDCEIEGDARDDYREHQMEEEMDQMIQVIEDLTGADLGLLSPRLSLPTLQRMVYDIGADTDPEVIKAIVKELRPNLDKTTLQSRINQAVEVVREVERMMVTR